VRLISSTGEQVGVVDPQAALAQGRAEGLDVVVIAEQADPPVCKVMDFGKFTFEKKKKEHESKKKQKVTQVKEVKFRPNIDDHDYDFKLKNIVRFLEDGTRSRRRSSSAGGRCPASTTGGKSWRG
jgi:translation initiation factor IF-3